LIVIDAESGDCNNAVRMHNQINRDPFIRTRTLCITSCASAMFKIDFYI